MPYYSVLKKEVHEAKELWMYVYNTSVIEWSWDVERKHAQL